MKTERSPRALFMISVPRQLMPCKIGKKHVRPWTPKPIVNCAVSALLRTGQTTKRLRGAIRSQPHTEQNMLSHWYRENLQRR